MVFPDNQSKMYYVLFEATPFEGKEKLAEQFYMSLLPHLNEMKGKGFHEDTFRLSPHVKRSANVAIWDDADAAWRWRMQENHLRLQKKGSEIVHESYRIRLGPEVTEGDDADNSKARHYVTLFYRNNVEGTPQNEVTALLDAGTAAQLNEDMLDSAVYSGDQTLWITAWRSEEAAIHFEQCITTLPEDRLVRMRVDRDYTKTDRTDAPNENPGMV